LRKNNKLSIDGWGKLDYLIQIYELNLVNNTMRVTKSVDYNYEGKILLDFNSRNPEIIKILPGSMGELLQKEVCPK
jgi:hypothetical protein